VTRQTAAAPATILIVDDELQTLKYFARAFASEFEVLTCANASEAEALFEARSGGISIIVSDQRMPGMEGVTLLTRIKQRWPATVRVLTTAYADMDSLSASINQAEVHRYVAKPWDLGQLRETLDEMAATHARHGSPQGQTEGEGPELPPLVGSVAHELATPLLSIEMASQSICKAVQEHAAASGSAAPPSVHLDRIEQVARRIGEDAARTRRLARALAELSREVTQRSTFKRVTAAGCVRMAVETFPYQPGERRAVKLDLADDFAFLGTDVLMGAVITNLLSNALEASRRSATPQVTVALHAAATGNRIVIRDNGPGVDSKIAETAFRPFGSGRQGGTGLGLSICAWIVRSFGGELRLETLSPPGAQVVITLPPAQPQARGP
jgi:signal transduction histidine kinase